MSWERVKLGDVIDTCLGKMLDQNKNRGEYEPYLANVNVRWGSFDLDNLPLMKFEETEQERYSLKYGDIVVCEGGEPGRCAIWKEQLPNMKIQKALHRVRPHDDVDYRYLYYWLLHAGRTGVLAQYYTGATIKHLPGDKLKSILFDKPPLVVQQKIGDLLSPFDDLIENNQEQIKLLEEATQRLYKEWFTGADICDLDDATLSGIVTFKRGKTITKSQTADGNVPVVAGGLEPAYYHNEANTVAPVITVSGSGANAGFARMYFEDVFASDCSFADSESTPYLYFVYCFLKDNKTQLDALQKGSAQPHVYAKDINAMVMKSVPTQKLEEFCEIVKPYFDLMGNLEKQSKSAIEARDRLLPKLMNGEIKI